jgi:hypothetical protein
MDARLKIGIRVTLAYVGAALSASFVSLALLLAFGMLSQGFKPTGYHPSAASIFHLAAFSLVFCTVATAIASCIPILIVQILAQQFSIRSPGYYIGAGALTGLLLSPLALYVITEGQGFESPALVALCVLTIVPGGAVGGFVYWLMDGRHLGSKTSSTPTAA